MANYLYNGVELPELPEWDKETYPYALIFNIDGTYVVSFGKNKKTAYPNGEISMPALSVVFEFTNGQWNEIHWTAVIGHHPFVWTNYDVYYMTDSGEESDTLCMVSSNPIRLDSKLSISVGQMMDFNGLVLPPLPDVGSYQYAVIGHCEVHGYVFSCSDNSWTANEDGQIWPSRMRAYYLSGGTWVQTYGVSFITPIWSTHDILDASGEVCIAASDPVPVPSATFTCSNLNTTDSVYKIAAWCYPKGTSYLEAPLTYVSETAFAGADHSESWGLTGLTAGTEYELYACIMVDDVATDHNGLVTFTLGEETTPSMLVTTNQITGEGFTLYLLTQNLTMGKQYIAEVLVYLPDSSAVVFEDELTIEGSGIDYITVTGLEPETEYAVSVDIYPAPSGEVVLHGDHTVTTTAAAIVKRDSFPLGFASGLCGTVVTKTDAEYNSWMWGYIVGSALRKAL